MRRRMTAVGIALAAGLWLHTGTLPAQPPAAEAVAEPAADTPALRLTPRKGESLRKGLQKTTDGRFVDVPLSDAVASLADAAGVPILIDQKALEEEGILLDEPINHVEPGATVETLLDRILSPLGLVWVIEDDAVTITSLGKGSDLGRHVRVAYDVRPLLEQVHESRAAGRFERLRNVSREYSTNGRGRLRRLGWTGASSRSAAPPPVERSAAAALVDAIIRTIGDPASWENQGGPGSMTILDGRLVVRQPADLQERIESLLEELLRLAKAEPNLSATPVHRRHYPTEADAATAVALKKKIAVDFVETPLSEALDSVAKSAGVTLMLDQFAFAEEGVEVDAPVTLALSDAPARSVLRRVLSPLGFTQILDRGAVIVTSELVAEDLDNLSIVIHDARPIVRAGNAEPLADLVVRTLGHPFEWEDHGGTGAIAVIGDGLLVVRQTQAVQDEIASLLRDLASAPSAEEAEAGPDDRPLLDYTLPDHDPQQVVQLLVRTIDPPHWDAENGGTIRVVGQQLFVRTTRENHVRIHELLRRLSRHARTGATNAGTRLNDPGVDVNGIHLPE